MENSRILLVDDEAALRFSLKMHLKEWGFTIDEACDGEEAVALVRSKPFDIVLSDIRMGRMDGLTALQEMLTYNPALPVVLMTAFESIDTVQKALRLGAYDYLVKPFDPELLKQTLQKAIDQSRHSIENKELRRQLSDLDSQQAMIGKSPAIMDMLRFIATVAPTDATVLITGESGTGKELVARTIHASGNRQNKPMVTVNCAALAENLLESELFGHEKGSFTGADKRREGRFFQADGGTLFLDEIGEMPLSLQAKLLRALQQGEIQRVGSDNPIHVDVRVIAATNRDLKAEAAAKRFREDLYFRLNVINIEVPPLRMRGDDIPILSANFLQRFAGRNHKVIKGFAPQAMDSLRRYSWPGNVRELENTIERAAILCNGDLIMETDLPREIIFAPEPDPEIQTPGEDLAGMPLDMVEKHVIEKTLELTQDNKSEAARRLGITRATLHNKLRKYGLE